MIKYLFPFLCAFALIAACDLEREIDINLPEYNNELVLESYIEAGLPLRALVTESISYTELPSPTPLDENTPIVITSDGQQLDPLPLSQLRTIIGLEGEEALAQFEGFVNFIELIGLTSGATVKVSHNGQDYILEEGVYFDFDNIKIYNYGNPYIVPVDYDNPFSIEVNASQDRNATATTSMLAPVPIDSINYIFNSTDTLASVQTWITDDAAVDNYYRFMLHGSKLTDTLYQNASFNDRFFNGDDVPLGSNFNFGIGDTSIVTLFHIDEIYHDFLETYQAALFANGNPFAQPAQILTNVEGGRGIFASLSYVRDTVIIE